MDLTVGGARAPTTKSTAEIERLLLWEATQWRRRMDLAKPRPCAVATFTVSAMREMSMIVRCSHPRNEKLGIGWKRGVRVWNWFSRESEGKWSGKATSVIQVANANANPNPNANAIIYYIKLLLGAAHVRQWRVRSKFRDSPAGGQTSRKCSMSTIGGTNYSVCPIGVHGPVVNEGVRAQGGTMMSSKSSCSWTSRKIVSNPLQKRPEWLLQTDLLYTLQRATNYKYSTKWPKKYVTFVFVLVSYARNKDEVAHN